MKKHKKIIVYIALFLALCFGGFGVYVMDYYHAEESATEFFVSEDIQIYSQGNMLVFEPETSTAGFIFYPGGKVEHTSYAPLMKQLAENNILCIITKMPFNLAVLDINAAESVIEQFPNINNWHIGGHSLGGSMAAAFAAENTDIIDSLVLLAAYSTSDITQTDLRILSVYGDADGVLDMEKYKEYFSNLPNDTKEIVIKGGNHAQFGTYGLQNGDGIASITVQRQLLQTSNAIVDMIK